MNTTELFLVAMLTVFTMLTVPMVTPMLRRLVPGGEGLRREDPDQHPGPGHAAVGQAAVGHAAQPAPRAAGPGAVSAVSAAGRPGDSGT